MYFADNKKGRSCRYNNNGCTTGLPLPALPCAAAPAWGIEPCLPVLALCVSSEFSPGVKKDALHTALRMRAHEDHLSGKHPLPRYIYYDAGAPHSAILRNGLSREKGCIPYISTSTPFSHTPWALALTNSRLPAPSSSFCKDATGMKQGV